LSGSGCTKHSLSQYIEPRSSISLPFDQLETGNLSLDLTLTPRERQSHSTGRIGTGIWVGKWSEKTDCQRGTTRRFILIPPTKSWDLHPVPNLRRKAHTEFTKTVRGDSPLEQLSSRLMSLLLNMRGNCSCFREKPAHMVGQLPSVWYSEGITRSQACTDY